MGEVRNTKFRLTPPLSNWQVRTRVGGDVGVGKTTEKEATHGGEIKTYAERNEGRLG